MAIKIITVDDHDIFRKGLNMIINQMKDIEVIAEANNGKDFLDLLPHYKADIIFMDIQMPQMNGIEATKAAIIDNPELKIVAISMFGEERYLEEMIKAGAKGFLLKNVDKTEIEHAIKQVVAGKNYYSSELIPYFTQKFICQHNTDTDKACFTNREFDILKLIAKGFTSKEIGINLYISKRTVDGHKSNMISKTGSKNVIDLLIYAIKNEFVKI